MTDLSATREFIQSLPKTETHLHAEGALPWELLEKKTRKSIRVNLLFGARLFVTTPSSNSSQS